ncbi:hypothetical protein NE857_03955 [Nocardiopsis exhalans]|uniref:Uncharacterized protein n=1 Tax=Nocardiopsis exhalans TaxID=163604 RepID=A0ABY5DCN9_9ACTN|nr:hypothetical protein [Nocardiopsis exhalans]USY20818.1 hypothetical protein NE857_03955 [Nocardiopsis exhalans]
MSTPPTPTPQPHPVPQDPPQGSGQQYPEQYGPGQYDPGHRAPGFAPPVPPHIAAAHPAAPPPAAPPPALPPVRPHRNWYWGTALFLPAGVLITTLGVQIGGAPLSSPWLLAPFISLLPTVVWPVVIYLMRDGSERRRRGLLPPPPTLMHIAPHPGAPTYPVWFQPRTSPPLDPRNLRPRRFWYAVAVLSPVLSPLISGIAFNVVGDWLGALLGILLFFVIPPALVVVVLVRRAAHRKRIVHEHLLKEWKQAHGG